VRRALTVPALVGVESEMSGDVRGPDGVSLTGVRISGISAEILDIRSLRVETGRPFSPQEATRGVPVAILGKSVSAGLFGDRPPIGETVRIRGFPFRVVGVLEEQGTLFGRSLDNIVIVPALSPVRRFRADRNSVGTISIRTVDPDDLATAMIEAEVAMRLTRRLRPGEANTFALETAEESLDFWNQISTILFLALPGLVGISLVVGGIVIMNIMLMSVLDRTREIGVRLAIGARRSDIVLQFLVEAGSLSGVGALIGVGLGAGMAWTLRAFSPLPAAVAPHWVVFGVLLGVSVGVVAGVYPAIRASRLDPVVALRHE
jgi:putative ABC transport system permease protein